MLLTVNWYPSRRELRVFGIAAVVAAAGIGGFLHLAKDLPFSALAIILALGLAICVTSFLSLRIGRWLFVGLTLVAMPLGLIVSFLVIGLLYFLLLTPMAFLLRISGRSTVARQSRGQSETFWHDHEQEQEPRRYFQQF